MAGRGLPVELERREQIAGGRNDDRGAIGRRGKKQSSSRGKRERRGGVGVAGGRRCRGRRWDEEGQGQGQGKAWRGMVGEGQRREWLGKAHDDEGGGGMRARVARTEPPRRMREGKRRAYSGVHAGQMHSREGEECSEGAGGQQTWLTPPRLSASCSLSRSDQHPVVFLDGSEPEAAGAAAPCCHAGALRATTTI